MFMKKISSTSRRALVLIVLVGGIASYCVVIGRERTVVAVGISIGEVVVAGMARIVKVSSQLSKVSRGDIIVASMTDVSWEPAMSLAAGIITDHGDVSCHAATFGKKMGIPVVVGTYNATQKIVDGQVVTIDCDHNTVYAELVPTVSEVVTHKPVATANREIFLASHNSSVAPSAVCSGSGYNYSSSFGSDLVVENHGYEDKRHKPVYDAKALYAQHYFGFQKYVLDLKSQLDKTPRSVVEWGARWVKKYNNFTIACIPIANQFFCHDKKKIVEILKRLSTDKSFHRIAHSIERCKQKPSHMKLFDWIAQVSHEEHINNITLPAGIQRERLIARPEEYQKIIHAVSAEERDILIAEGLLVRYFFEENKL